VKIIKKVLLTAAVIIFVIVAGLSVIISLKHDQLAGALLKKVNSTLNTKVSYKSLNVSLWGAFPDVSFRFKDVLIRPSFDYSRQEFGNLNSDTLLSASTLSVSVDLRSVISGQTIIKGISCKDGVANLLSDTNGKTNFQILNTDSKKESSANVRLDLISAKNIKIVFADRATDILIRGYINSSSVSGEIFGTGIDLSVNVNMFLYQLQVYGFKFGERTAEANLQLFKTTSSVSFRKGSLRLGELLFNLDGSIDFEHKWLGLTVKGHNIDISDIVTSLPAKFSAPFKGIKPGGIVEISGVIKGEYGMANAPHFDFQYNLSNGRLIYGQSGIDVNDLYLKGEITNGSKNNRETFLFTVDPLKAALGAARFNGSLKIENLNEPLIVLTLNADLVFNDLRKFIKTKSFDSSEGAVSGNLSLNGRLPSGEKLSVASLPHLNPVANIRLESFAADFPETGLFMRDVSGKIRLDKDLFAENLSMTILDQKYCFNCNLSNFTGWIAGSGELLDITGDITADTFNPSAFAATQKEKPGGDRKDKSVDLFPKDVLANVTFHANHMINNKLHAEDFSCNLSYKPFVLSFNNISAKCLDGSILGDFMIGRKSDGSYVSKSGLTLNAIDIRKAFVAFNNFGQKFIISENLGGRLTGTISLLTMVDKDFKILTPTTIAETHISVLDGRLIDFKPVEELSRFINLDELRDISFSKLENDIFVKNSTLSVPKMQITSSVGSFSIYGNHNFNGDYSYHIRVLLSEVLSKKAREKNRHKNDFGQIADDGLGKTTLPLKLESKNGKSDVSYDFGQSKEIVKESITVEKKSLKSLLNEEYGWYKEDTTVKANVKTESKPKFSITWEEGKEQNKEQEVTEEEDETSLRDLFKRKK